MRIVVGMIVVTGIFLLGGWDHDYDKIAARRSEYARSGLGDIVVVAIDDPGDGDYINGIRLAVKQLNERPGKLLGRNLQLRVKPGGSRFEAVQDTILGIARDPRVTAVFGHSWSKVAIPASVIYQASQIVFMPPCSTDQGLTAHGFNFVFRMVPDNAFMANQSASVAELLGYRNFGLLYAQDEHNREMAFAFEDAATTRGMSVLYRQSFSPGEIDHRKLIAQIANEPVDTVFLSADPDAAGRVVRQLREMGVMVPIMGDDALNRSRFKATAGEAGDNTIVPVTYHAHTNTRTNLAFLEAYRQLFKTDPDGRAAQGYDSLRLLAAAIERAKSTLPARISSTLHYMPPWAGVTGVHAFDAHGDVYGKKYFFQVLRDKAWHFLPAVHMPYFLERFDHAIQAKSGRKDALPRYAERFSVDLHPQDLRLLQLEFLHELLRFQRLGVIHGEDDSGHEPVGVERMKDLGKKRGFTVTSCSMDTAAADRPSAERQLLECYGKLSLLVDALTVTELRGVDRDIAVRLQKPLEAYRIPVLALQGDTDFDEEMAVWIGRLGDIQDLHAYHYLNLFNGILHGKDTHELVERLDNLPVVVANLKLLSDYGLLRSGRLNGFAPGLYLEWFVSSP